MYTWAICLVQGKPRYIQTLPYGYHFCRRQISFTKCLDQDYDRQLVGPDLDTNCLVVGIHERMFEKDKGTSSYDWALEKCL